MSLQPPPEGTSVSLIRLADRRALGPGALTAEGTVHVPATGAGSGETGRLLAVAQVSGRQYIADAAHASADAGRHVYRLTSAWRMVERRAQTRYSTDLRAEVNSVLGRSRQKGRLIDVSADGAAVEVHSRPGGRQLELVIDGVEYSASLPVRLVSALKTESGVLLHVRFDELTSVQQAFLRNLLARLARGEAVS
ncbi:hypothetical protein AYO38_07865 [bacterium SCGC AG-212-C10]|nr:hypothetical protein AYO38_07865 [bacterium SCGC AG-212-C10]